MDSTIEKEGNELPYNTTEEVWNILSDIVNEKGDTDAKIYLESVLTYIHNNALSQVLEKMYTLPSYNLDGIGEKDCIMFEDLKVLITSLQKE